MAWLEGWDYRKPITVTDENADFQSKILIGKTSDAVGEDVDCGGHIADDFDDLRFTAADGTTLLDYWIESIVDSGGTKLATVWVENNSTPDTTLYMYYSGTETAVSSGDNTFPFLEYFDNLNTEDINGQHGWVAHHLDVGEKAEITEAQYVSSPKSYRAFSDAAGNHTVGAYRDGASKNKNLEVTMRARMGESANCNYGHFAFLEEDSTICVYLTFFYSGDFRYYDGSMNALSTPTSWVKDTWYSIKLIVKDNDTYDIYIDGSLKQSNAGMWNGMTNGINRHDAYIGSAGKNVDTELFVDNIMWRKYAATEPSFAWGNEEENPIANMKINISDTFKDAHSVRINIGDSWKAVTKVQQNIGDSWKDVF